MTLATFPPLSPPRFPTPDNVFEGVVKTSADLVMAAPSFVEVRIVSHPPETVTDPSRSCGLVIQRKYNI